MFYKDLNNGDSFIFKNDKSHNHYIKEIDGHYKCYETFSHTNCSGEDEIELNNKVVIKCNAPFF